MRERLLAAGSAAGLYLVLAAVLTWPLVLHPGSRVPSDLGDPLLNVFLLAWNARELPFTERWWNLPQFHPASGTMAFSEHLLGISLLSTPIIKATGNPLLGYNVAFFLSFPLCGLAAYLLTYEITKRHDASIVAGVAFGFAPYRMTQLAHVQVLSSYWMPLALLGLHLFLREPRWRWLVLFAGSWYMQALACGYYLFYLSVLIGCWILWFAIGRMHWSDVAKIAVAWCAAAVAFAPVALGYMQYQGMYGLERGVEEIEGFSADVASVLNAPGNLRLWRWLQVFDRQEAALFPGLAVILLVSSGVALAWVAAARPEPGRRWVARVLLALAVVSAVVAALPVLIGPSRFEIAGIRLLSLRSSERPLLVGAVLALSGMAMHPSVRAMWRRRSALAFYTVSAIVMWSFSLGPSPTLMGQPLAVTGPYGWLMMLPGVEGIRVPARFWMLSTLCLAVAAALAMTHLHIRTGARRIAFSAVTALLIAVEGWPTPVGLLQPPDLRPSYTSASARLEIPADPIRDLLALYRATEHRLPLVNGYSGYFAPHYDALQDLLARHDADVLRSLASFGELEIVVDQASDRSGGWRTFVGATPGAELLHEAQDYTVYRLPRTERPAIPSFAGDALPVTGIHASVNEDRLGLALDGNLKTRWDTGPQDPTNELIIDLGAARRVEGIELQMGRFRTDFPRELTVSLSDDGVVWTPGWGGATALLAFEATVQAPVTVPLRFPADQQVARYIRLRQTAQDPVYYWSIAELRVYGKADP